MARRHRWVGLYAGGIVASFLTFSLAYNIGMRTIENEPQSLLHSLELILLYMFTVGFATDYPSSDLMVALVLLTKVTGKLIILVTLIAIVALIVHERSMSRVLRS